MKRQLLAAVLTAVVVTALAVAGSGNAVAATRPDRAAPASARYRLNPAHNIAPPTSVYGTACRSHPLGAPCVGILVGALDDARAAMGEPDYATPTRFASLAPLDQLLVLADLDRRLYGRAPITGRNPQLNASAATGAAQQRDPAFVRQVDGAQAETGAANWAGGSAPMGSPLYAYYLWMYDDGPGGPNGDCRHAGDAGCWGHRDGTLLQAPAGAQVEMGAGRATPNGTFSWTELFEAFPSGAVIPCVPTVTGLSAHTGRTAGGPLTVRGFGFVQLRRVTVLGKPATVSSSQAHALAVTAPAHAAGSGYVSVVTPAGFSSPSAAAAYTYQA